MQDFEDGCFNLFQSYMIIVLQWLCCLTNFNEIFCMFRGVTVSNSKTMLAVHVLIYGITHTTIVMMILSTRPFTVENKKIISSFLQNNIKTKDEHIYRYCNQDWFKNFDFTCYSKAENGLYCMGCALFLDTSHCHSK